LHVNLDPSCKFCNVRVRIVIFLISLGACFSASAQAPPIEPEAGPRYPERAAREEPVRRPLARRNVWVSEYEPNSLEKQLLEPSLEDQQRFAEFLRLPDTGVIRMFPPGRRRVISVSDLATGRRPGFGSYASLYSFSKQKHGHGLHGYVDPRLGWAELRLWNGRFVTGVTGESLGVLVALGDVPLESVTPETYGVTGLTNIMPPADYFEAATLSRRNRAGFALEKFRYGSALPVAENTTYVLRATSNKRADVLVGFRVVRLEENGSVTLIWRKLKVYPKPTWKRRSD
jgi:hypothetical protein